MIIVGGDINSFQTAMTSLRRNFPVLVIDESGGAANFISDGYEMIMHTHSERTSTLPEEFISEMKIAADNYFGPAINYTANTKDLKLKIKTKQKYIYVYSPNDTSDSLERTVQDALFQSLCKDKQDNWLREEKLRFVNLWNRPDLIDNEMFWVDSKQFLESTIENPESSLTKLFLWSLMHDTVEVVSRVLENIKDDQKYKLFLQNNLHELYTSASGMAGQLLKELISDSQSGKSNEKVSVKTINAVVEKLFGSKGLVPFQEGKVLSEPKGKTSSDSTGKVSSDSRGKKYDCCSYKCILNIILFIMI
ncbi:transient receptor potential cation channel subfamily M member-like 2 [Mytilus edulis]|uniref:transient receptor potential cation channel subfamily M member-like 2 n=1 Tax=Mytilus edulis TaxID=6550 RepID=UPI0039F11448